MIRKEIEQALSFLRTTRFGELLIALAVLSLGVFNVVIVVVVLSALLALSGLMGAYLLSLQG